MDKVLKYEAIISKILEIYAKDWSNGKDLHFDVVFDPIRHHYQLICLGWINGDYIHNIPIHIEIKDGKVWIQKNSTEEYIAEVLVQNGIPKSDIVLGLQPPEYRPYTEYAVA